MNSPDVLGTVLSEATQLLDKNKMQYTVKSIPMRLGDESKTKRIIRQRIINNSNNNSMTELLIAYF